MGILMRNGINYSGSQLPSVTTEDSGKILTVNNNGAWAAQEVPTDEQVSEAVDEWLTAHPEATTTVQDNSLTWVKFNDVLKDMMFKLGITDSKSGALVSTSDAAEFPLKDLQTEITATQNLNGYEYPWVGGAGKNLCPPDIEQGAFNENGLNTPPSSIAYPTRVRTQGYIPINSGTTITVSATGNAAYFTVSGYTVNDYTTPRIQSTSWIALGGSFTINEDVKYIRIAFRKADTSANITPSEISDVMCEYGSTATAYAPYENICPISGRTEVNVTRTGKNLLGVGVIDRTTLGVTITKLNDGGIMVNGTTKGNIQVNDPSTTYAPQKLHAGRTYTLSGGMGRPTSDAYLQLIYVDDVTGATVSLVASEDTRTYTPTHDCSYRSTYMNVMANKTFDNGVFYPQLELGSTATAYEPYEGDTFNTELGRTVYGGTLDLTTGVLTVNTGLIASYNGETIGEPWISDRDRYVAGTTPTIGAQVVYTKDSETYQVDRTEVDAYFKNNTIWSDSGDVAVSYLVDAKTYIDNH